MSRHDFPGMGFIRQSICGVENWFWRNGDTNTWYVCLADWYEIRDFALASTSSRGCVIQAGGCMGLYPRLWAEDFHLVYTFEPDPFNFSCLVMNCVDKENIVKTQAALGDKPGRCSLAYPAGEESRGMAKMIEGDSIPVVRLDDFDFAEVSVIQLDCEGSEAGVLRGAMQTIEKHKPLVIIEGRQPEVSELLVNYEMIGERGCAPDTFYRVK